MAIHVLGIQSKLEMPGYAISCVTSPFSAIYFLIPLSYLIGVSPSSVLVQFIAPVDPGNISRTSHLSHTAQTNNKTTKCNTSLYYCITIVIQYEYVLISLRYYWFISIQEFMVKRGINNEKNDIV